MQQTSKWKTHLPNYSHLETLPVHNSFPGYHHHYYHCIHSLSRTPSWVTELVIRMR